MPAIPVNRVRHRFVIPPWLCLRFSLTGAERPHFGTTASRQQHPDRCAPRGTCSGIEKATPVRRWFEQGESLQIDPLPWRAVLVTRAAEVELRGIEPLTSSMPWKRSAN